jgi:CHAD domain-containing protein
MAPDSNRTQALFDKLLRFSQLSSSARPETVHQLRTTIRRVETLVAASPPAPGRKEQKMLKQLDRLRRRAGKVRDLDAQIAALDGLRLESAARDRARVMAFLEKARARRESKLLCAFQKEAERGLHKRLKRTGARLQHDSQTGAGEQRFLEAALEKFAAAAEHYPALNESNLHAFRMASKRVRYLAEMAGDSPRAAAVIEPLKRIQDSIGGWHDSVTLIATAESVLKPSGQAPLISALRASARSRYLEALRVTADASRALLELRPEPGKRPARLAVPSPVARAASA